MEAWAVVFATLMGPILAVQAQKAIERARERRTRKSGVFHQLMATRAARVAAEHVQALNMIDLAFYGRHILGIHRRSKSEDAVISAWREYHEHLNVHAADDAQRIWNVRSDELFTNLLFAMAADVGFKFDRVQLKKAYSPVAHGELEEQQRDLRKHAIAILNGESSLKMEVTGFPIDQDALRAQIFAQEQLAAALNDRGALTVKIKRDEGVA